MGGCYTDYNHLERQSSNTSRTATKKPKKKSNPLWQQELKEFSKTREISHIVAAYKGYFKTRTKGGFFAKLASACDIENVVDIPKEFPEIEYEVKFDITPRGSGTEPGIEEYLNAFDFPVSNGTRFMKDPVNNISEGINHFIGNLLDERVVIIEKAGGKYIKEKGLVTKTDTGVQYESIVIKRTESRHSSTMEEIIKKITDVSATGDEYQGKIRKEKGDAFILDTYDGRIYSMSMTRTHLIKPGESIESRVQRQLELEYAGYIPGFKSIEKNSEAQLIESMVSLAKYISIMYTNAPISSGWRISLAITGERKYDFIMNGTGKSIEKKYDSMNIFDPGFSRHSERLIAQKH